jgi:hypothetical protein
LCLSSHVGYKQGEGKAIVRDIRNIDVLVRTVSGWRIRRRVHPAVWAFEVPGAMLADAGS